MSKLLLEISLSLELAGGSVSKCYKSVMPDMRLAPLNCRSLLEFLSASCCKLATCDDYLDLKEYADLMLDAWREESRSAWRRYCL